MKLVVGLGNPGRKYRETRHNVGFDTLAQLARDRSAGPVVSRFQGELVDYVAGGSVAGNDGDGRVLLLCPTTYMNRSGQSVRQAVDFYKLPVTDVLVVCDDFSLPLGKLRFRPSGSAGGQKGLADIIRHLGDDQIARLRIGIGKPPPQWDPADFVLSRFPAEEQSVISEAIQRAARGIEDWVASGTDWCMNRYNGEQPG